MEPSPKRMRMSPRHEPDTDISRRHQEKRLFTTQATPTKTVDLLVVRRRGMQVKHNAGIHLVPRVPDVTVTANVINIGILDGSDEISATMISAPTANSELAISGVGVVTVPAFTPGSSTSALGSAASITPSVTTTGTTIGSTTAFLSSSPSGNATSSIEHTVTITATSTFLVPLQNSTANMTLFSTHRTVFTTEGFTTTMYDSPSTSDSTAYRFGDLSSVASKTITAQTEGAGTTAATTSSATEATSSGAAPAGTVVLTPQQQQVVGGVVGGVAGVALVLLAILYLLKWYRQRLESQGRFAKKMLRHRQLPSGDDHDYIAKPAMAEQSGISTPPVAALKHSLANLRPHSNYTFTSSNTERSSMPTVDSERGFQRVTGRKIPSVLLTGGDGFDGQRPVSPSSVYSYSFPQSRALSQVSSFHENNQPTNPFLDPAVNDDDFVPVPLIGIGSTPQGFSRSQLSIQTGPLTAFNPNRQSEVNVMIRPSPARTPTTASPTSLSLRQPMYTPPLMAGDIPDLPSFNPFRNNLASKRFNEDPSGAQRPVVQRTVSAMSTRSGVSVGGKFKEEI